MKGEVTELKRQIKKHILDNKSFSRLPFSLFSSDNYDIFIYSNLSIIFLVALMALYFRYISSIARYLKRNTSIARK
jgi:hypothetical protein